MDEVLDHIIWHALSGPQAHFSTGTSEIRRYAPGFSPIIGYRSADKPDLVALEPFTTVGEHFYCVGWPGLPPPTWEIEEESFMYRMVWHGSIPSSSEAADALPLSLAHAPQALELATLTRPGPFGLRTLELGDYFGYFEGERLIAMAGERMQAGSFREVSGVCTHPDFQGRGIARSLMLKLIRRHMVRGQITFLHVMGENKAAQRLYERMGFRVYREVPVRILLRRA